MSIAIFAVLILGVLGGVFLPEGLTSFLSNASSTMLLLLLFSVGIDLGLNKQVFAEIKRMGFRILFIPVGVVLGSLWGGIVLTLLLQTPMKEGLAISSGLGWYSLSGILITEAGNPVGGTVAFLSNVFREILSFISIPFLAKYLNHYTAIAPAGATSMDTTLGIISRNTSPTVAVLAFVNGAICTLVVPMLVQAFL